VTIYAARRSIACYVTRPSGAGRQLLLVDQVLPGPSGAEGPRIPTGDMLPFESVDAAARRVIDAESGLDDVTLVAQLGAVELGLHEPGGPSLTTYVHLAATGGGDRPWEHRIDGEGEASGTTLLCRWEPLPLDVELAGAGAAFLDRIAG
jgi:hypothetical protein